MKIAKFNNLVGEIKMGVGAYCAEKKLDTVYAGDYSLAIKFKRKQNKSCADELVNYLIETLNLTRKKIRKILTFVFCPDRMYVVFKSNSGLF